MKNKGWSGDNIAFGMGGGLLQKLNRDTQMFAFKCSSVVVDGVQRNVMKSPIGAEWKRSKFGRLMLIRSASEGKFMTVEESVAPQLGQSMLETVFENGEIVKEYTFDEVRKNASF